MISISKNITSGYGIKSTWKLWILPKDSIQWDFSFLVPSFTSGKISRYWLVRKTTPGLMCKGQQGYIEWVADSYFFLFASHSWYICRNFYLSFFMVIEDLLIIVQKRKADIAVVLAIALFWDGSSIFLRETACHRFSNVHGTKKVIVFDPMKFAKQ